MVTIISGTEVTVITINFPEHTTLTGITSFRSTFIGITAADRSVGTAS